MQSNPLLTRDWPKQTSFYLFYWKRCKPEFHHFHCINRIETTESLKCTEQSLPHKLKISSICWHLAFIWIAEMQSDKKHLSLLQNQIKVSYFTFDGQTTQVQRKRSNVRCWDYFFPAASVLMKQASVKSMSTLIGINWLVKMNLSKCEISNWNSFQRPIFRGNLGSLFKNREQKMVKYAKNDKSFALTVMCSVDKWCIAYCVILAYSRIIWSVGLFVQSYMLWLYGR